MELIETKSAPATDLEALEACTSYLVQLCHVLLALSSELTPQKEKAKLS